ncbi:hypothetical protein FHG87_017822 [Trinorchestia longiramus]|nr:hypothetical protein FHG87_017822 [Trinorchestia longiramus]
MSVTACSFVGDVPTVYHCITPSYFNRCGRCWRLHVTNDLPDRLVGVSGREAFRFQAADGNGALQVKGGTGIVPRLLSAEGSCVGTDSAKVHRHDSFIYPPVFGTSNPAVLAGAPVLECSFEISSSFSSPWMTRRGNLSVSVRALTRSGERMDFVPRVLDRFGGEVIPASEEEVAMLAALAVLDSDDDDFSSTIYSFFGDISLVKKSSNLLHPSSYDGRDLPPVQKSRTSFAASAALCYRKHKWLICGDLNVVGLILELQGGYTKYPCFLCSWDSRADDQHCVRQEWPSRQGLKLGSLNVVSHPLVEPSKILLPPFHIKLDLMKNFVMALDSEGGGLLSFIRSFNKKAWRKLGQTPEQLQTKWPALRDGLQAVGACCWDWQDLMIRCPDFEDLTRLAAYETLAKGSTWYIQTRQDEDAVALMLPHEQPDILDMVIYPRDQKDSLGRDHATKKGTLAALDA